MASIRVLLDTFGPPPEEICLDWACQIHTAAQCAVVVEPAPGAFEAAPHCVPDETDWTSLEVADDGCLQLDGLTAAMASRALEELRSWLAREAPGSDRFRDAQGGSTDREMALSEETLGASARVDLPAPDCEFRRSHATGRRCVRSRLSWFKERRSRLTAAAALLGSSAAILIVAYGWIAEEHSNAASVTELASSTAGSDDASLANSGSQDDSAHVVEDDYLAAPHDQAFEGDWTTSAELTSQALGAVASQHDDEGTSRQAVAIPLTVPPSLSSQWSEATPGPLAASQGMSSPPDDSARSPTTANSVDNRQEAIDAQPAPALEVGDVLSQVASAVAKAEAQPAGERDADMIPESGADAEVATGTGSPSGTDQTDQTHQSPLMLTRGASSLVSPVPRGTARRAREPRWTARIEVADDFVCEPAALQTLDARTGAQWRIYDKEAKSPRACIIVSVRQRSSRDASLEWSLRGGADDLPGLHLPVARKWLDTLSAQLKVTAASLRGITDVPTQNVPKELRSLAQNQRQLARQQLAVANRLLTFLADLDRLASLLDDELVCHVELRDGDGGPLLLAYGTCEAEPVMAQNEESRLD